MSKLLLAAAVCLCLIPLSGAQTRYEQYERLNLWNAGSNAASMRLDPRSYAEASLGAWYEAGEFRSSNDAASLRTAGASARAMQNMEKFSLRGSFSFSHTEASDACGSMFMTPGFFPVDVMEFTPGRKTFQHYGLAGGISVPLGRRVLVGAQMDFHSANAAKRKDLRYTGYRLDFSFAPSVLIDLDSWYLGFSLIYGRNSETVDAEQIGSAQNAPYAFFNEGLHYGSYQVWTGSGTHLDESGVSGLPVLQNSYGLGVQAGTRSIYADATLSWLHGRVGERQTIWYRYRGPVASASFGLRSGSHTFTAALDWAMLDNRRTVMDKVVEGGVTNTVEYGSNRIWSQSSLGLDLGYEFRSGAFELRPSLQLCDRRTISLPAYPAVATEHLLGMSAGIEAWLAFGRFTMSPRTAFSMAGIDSRTDAEGRMDELYALSCEYETVPRLHLGSEFRYDFGKRYFAAVDAWITGAFGTELIEGPIRWGASLKIGMNFKY